MIYAEKSSYCRNFKKIMELAALETCRYDFLQYNNLVIFGHIGSTFFEVKSFTANEICAGLRKFTDSDIGYEV